MNADTRRKLDELVEPLRSRIAALLERTGERVWIGSGRRTMLQQIDLRRKHCGTSFYDIWQRPADQCNPTTARPGQSPHERGEAVDLEGDLSLIGPHLASLGLGTPVDGEPWHVEVTGEAAGLVGGGLPGPIDDWLGGGLAELVEPLTEGLARIALVGLFVAGGAALIVAGAARTART